MKPEFNSNPPRPPTFLLLLHQPRRRIEILNTLNIFASPYSLQLSKTSSKWVLSIQSIVVASGNLRASYLNVARHMFFKQLDNNIPSTDSSDKNKLCLLHRSISSASPSPLPPSQGRSPPSRTRDQDCSVDLSRRAGVSGTSDQYDSSQQWPIPFKVRR